MTSSIPTPYDLRGQVIAVTSADQGYGKVISHALSRAGASTVLIGNNPETLAAAASSIELAGGEAIPLKADVTTPMDWMSAQDRILEIFGALHGVVHLADRRASDNFSLLTEGEWMELFNLNVKSTVGITQLLARRLPGTWLTIIGPHLDETGLHTSPQRGGIRGLVEGAQSHNLRLNLVLPSRSSSGDEALDAPVSEAVLALASAGLKGLRGTVLDIPLEPAPRVKLPEAYL